MHSIEFDNVVGLGAGLLSLSSPIVALCGSNGAGKSTLLRLIEASINGLQAIDDPHMKARLESSSVRLIGEIDGERCVFERDFRADPNGRLVDSVSALLLNPAIESEAKIRAHRTITNFDEYLEAYTPAESAKSEVERMSYLVGREYALIRTYELGDDDNADPYFRVECGGVEYGEESMGLGELALHRICWRLQRLSEGTLLLLEEPETHVSPKSQVSLMDIVAERVAVAGIRAVVTTHSHSILTRVPRQWMRLISRLDNQPTIVDEPDKKLLSTVTGIGVSKSAILLVEDSTARELTKVLLRRFAPFLLSECEVADVGQSKMVAVASDFPVVGNSLVIVAVFDGDQRGKHKESTWPIAFLPGDVAPEKLLQSSSQSVIAALANASGHPPANISAILAALQGEDHHDWYVNLASMCGLALGQALEALVSAWCEDPDCKARAVATVAEINDAVMRGRALNSR
jgi:predicted ATPase